jgi:hypothetical protein
MPSLTYFTGVRNTNQHINWIKRGIWVYFFLLLFEGALRKWFLPELATPLLVIRDPLAFWLLFKAWQRGLLLLNPYLIAVVFIGLLSFISALVVGHGNLLVALFGVRILLLHFPLMFVIGKVFDRQDVVKIGKVLIIISIPMAVLLALQFYSPQLAWVNRGVGGDMKGAGFGGALGYYRPPGTFSFTNGTTLFFSMVGAYLFYFWFGREKLNRLLLVTATLALLIAIPLSISRALFFSVGVTLLFTLLAVARNPKYLGRTLIGIVGMACVLLLINQLALFQTGLEAFTSRFTSANDQEGGLEGVLVDRYLGGMVGALTGSQELPFFGFGIGMGSNVGSMLLGGTRTFLIAEQEWGRLIGEMGALLGIILIFVRLRISFEITISSYKKLKKGDLLPWLLLSFGLLVIPQGQWAQPTSLGFSTLIGGLLLASIRQKTLPKQKRFKENFTT